MLYMFCCVWICSLALIPSVTVLVADASEVEHLRLHRPVARVMPVVQVERYVNVQLNRDQMHAQAVQVHGVFIALHCLHADQRV